MTWLIPSLTWAAAIIVMYASKPARSRLAHLSALLMLALGVWQLYSGYQDWRTRQTLEKFVYSRLVKATYRTMGLVYHMVRQSSDAWVPYTEDDLFSERTAILVCRYLNIEAPAAHISIKPSWLTYLYQETKEYQDEFSAVLSSYSSSLDTELLQAVIDFKQSFLLTYPATEVVSRQVRTQMGYQQLPPLLCRLNEMAMKESLGQLRHLYEVIRERAGSHDYFTPWPANTPQPTQEPGPARFSDEDLQRWLAEHAPAPRQNQSK
jgi:hypothetical protein